MFNEKRSEIIDFLTIRKEIYNFYLGKVTQKVYRFYTNSYFPPTINYTLNPSICEVLKPIPKTLGLELQELPANIKEQFKDNIEIQEKVLNMIIKRNEQYNYRCGLIKLTTGKGKSHIIMDITNYYQTNTLILVHNVKTLSEMYEKFKNFTNISPAIYGGGKKNIGNITIMTKKSFSMDHNKLEKEFNLILIDEAPIGFSKNFWNAINIYSKNRKGIALYGLSGTPYKDELELEDLEKYFGRRIEVKGQKNNGYNYIPKFKMYDYFYSGRYLYENPAEMRTAISENTLRLNEQIQEINKLLLNRRCLLILTDRKQEVENFYNNIDRENNLVFIITGETSQKQDDENLKLAKLVLETADNKIIIIGTIQKVGVGVDIPFIDSIFLASAIKFKASVIQAIGRALRKYENKIDVICGIWNDLPILNSQKTEKIKAISEEYGINKQEIEFIQIGKQERLKI